MQKEQASFLKQISIPVTLILIWLIIGTLTFHSIEDWSFAESFYYSVTTLTTVGYGDYTPTTDINRIIVAFYMLIGVTIALGSFGYIGSSYLDLREDRRLKRAERIKRLRNKKITK
jgi:hypothetical protein